MLDARNRGRRRPDTVDQAGGVAADAPPGIPGIGVPQPRSLSIVADLSVSRTDPLVRLMSDEVRHDPFPFLDELRKRGRVVRASTAMMTAHHDICTQVMSDHATFSSAHSLHRPSAVPSQGDRPAEFAHHGVDALNGLDVPYAGALIAVDEPEHARLRRATEQAFRPTAVQRLRPDIEGLADGLLDGLAPLPSVDLVADYAQSLALMVIGDVLGVPSADWPQLRAWADDLVAAGDADTAPQRRNALRSQHALRRYLDDVLATRVTGPGGALVDAMIQLGDGGDGLSLREAGATALLVLQAGYETAATLIGNGIHALGRHPAQVEILLARPSLWGNAVDEIMRWNPALAVATRQAVRDTQLAGSVVPAGTRIVLALAGANRDPAVFDAPDIFDVERENADRHLGMGWGIHACVGGGLGRLIADAALRRLFERFPNLRFAAPPVRASGLVLRGFASLPVRLGRPAYAPPA